MSIKKFSNFMIDTETLSLKPNARIWEFAIVPFNLELVDRHTEAIVELDSAFHCLVDQDPLASVTSASTIEWTAANRHDVFWQYWRARFIEGQDMSNSVIPTHVLTGDQLYEILSGMIHAQLGVNIWCRNAAFDFDRLENLMGKLPWHRRQQCDVYTAINMAQIFNPGRKRADQDPPSKTALHAHHALDDCLKQINELNKAIEIVEDAF